MDRPDWLEIPDNLSDRQLAIFGGILVLSLAVGFYLGAETYPTPDTMTIVSGDPFLDFLKANDTVERGQWHSGGTVSDWAFTGDWMVTDDGKVVLRPVDEEDASSGIGRAAFVPDSGRSVAVLEASSPAAEMGIGEGDCRDARAVVQARSISGGVLSGIIGDGVASEEAIVGNQMERITVDVSHLDGSIIALEGWVQPADGGCGMSNGEMIQVHGLYLESGR